MDEQQKGHIKKLILILLCAKLLIVIVAATVPIEYTASLLGIHREDYMLNFNILHLSTNQPLVDKFGYTWDARWYMNIATLGYPTYDTGKNQFGWAITDSSKTLCSYSWPPLYPLMIRMLALSMDPKVAGLLISNVASFLSVALFYLLACKYVPKEVAFNASVLLALYPFNLSSWTQAYTEPIFLLFALLSWFGLMRGNVILAGSSAMLASSTRYPGLLLFPIMTFMYIQRTWGKTQTKSILTSIVILNIFAAPTLYWMLVQTPSYTGLTVLQIHSKCTEVLTDLTGVSESTGILAPLVSYLLTILTSVSRFDVYGFSLFFLWFAVLGAYMFRRLNAELTLYTWSFLLFHLLLPDGGMSIGRYIGVIWPLFIYYGSKFDRIDLAFFSIIFLISSVLLIILQVNWIIAY